MSLPKHHTPTLSSSSSSKQSLRGNTSSPRPRTIERRLSEQQQQQQQTEHATASPDPVQTGGHSGPLDEQQEDLVNPSGPGFKPFFTLIEDANSSEYYHPTVHYIFSDDDPELVTEAALRALETGNEPLGRHHHLEQGDQGYVEEGPETGPSGSRKQSLLPPPIPGVRERYIIVDLEPSVPQQHGHGASSAPDTATQIATAAGAASMSTSPAQQQQPQQPGQAFRIASAHSLTPDWQVLSTQLSPAPSFDTFNNHHSGEPSSSPSSSGALMLKIEGTSGFPRDIAPARGEDNKDQTLEEMMEQFEKRMGELRRVIEAGGDYPPRRPGLSRAGDTEDTGHGSDNNAADIRERGEEQTHDEAVELAPGGSHPHPKQE
ncbi:hypothetical protein VTN77DRAFT_1361 [Rasamsonia byssochlamydoides]|uniref:uncharacterized protein n=1 Tax=Rasamsonia byssochlamydoides TaxID=89139 RepID=UPI003743916D